MIAAGGTGGHVYPALAVAEAVHIYYPESSRFFVGSVDGFERPLVEQGGVAFESYDEVRAGPLHGVSPWRALRSLFELAAGTVTSLRLIGRHQPGVLLLTGGWVGFPVALAAWLRRVPILIFLPDIEPALSIKVLRHFAARVALAVPESASYFADGQTVVTGYPVREALASATRAAGRAAFNVDDTRPMLLVFGGSRGAQSINTAVIEMLPRLLAAGVSVVHVAGTLDYERVQAATADLPGADAYHLRAYLHGEEMGQALAGADLAVSRAGAAVLGEFPLFGLPSVLVPYPYAWRYQKVNAEYLAGHGAAVALADETLNTDLYEVVNELFTNAERLATMRHNVMKLAQPGGARRAAAELAQLAGEGDRA